MQAGFGIFEALGMQLFGVFRVPGFPCCKYRWYLFHILSGQLLRVKGMYNIYESQLFQKRMVFERYSAPNALCVHTVVGTDFTLM